MSAGKANKYTKAGLVPNIGKVRFAGFESHSAFFLSDLNKVMTAGAWTSKLRTERKVAKILNARCYLLYNGLNKSSSQPNAANRTET